MTKAEAYEFLADLIEHDDQMVELGVWSKAKDALELLRPVDPSRADLNRPDGAIGNDREDPVPFGGPPNPNIPPTADEIMQQLDRWISMCATDHPGDYHQALVDFRNLITRQGPYAVKP